MKLNDSLPSECTSIMVGKQQTIDGSRIISRSMDWDALHTINFERYAATDHGPKEFVALDKSVNERIAKLFGGTAL